MRRGWFRAWGWIYYPVSLGGSILTLLLVIFLLTVFRAVDSHSHSVSDTLYGIFPYWAPALLGWLWIASKSVAPAAGARGQKSS